MLTFGWRNTHLIKLLLREHHLLGKVRVCAPCVARLLHFNSRIFYYGTNANHRVFVASWCPKREFSIRSPFLMVQDVE